MEHTSYGSCEGWMEHISYGGCEDSMEHISYGSCEDGMEHISYGSCKDRTAVPRAPLERQVGQRSAQARPVLDDPTDNGSRHHHRVQHERP